MLPEQCHWSNGDCLSGYFLKKPVKGVSIRSRGFHQKFPSAAYGLTPAITMDFNRGFPERFAFRHQVRQATRFAECLAAGIREEPRRAPP
jgi:hypothetical protein